MSPLTMPLNGLVLGLFMLLYGALSYTGVPLPKPLPRRKGDRLWLAGCLLIAIAFMLGMIGYWGLIGSDVLRPLRVVLGAIGLLLLAVQFKRTKPS